MAKNKKPVIPYDTRGGVIVVYRRMMESKAYKQLKPQEKVLMLLLQLHWRLDKPVDYGVREAAQKIPCDRKTAMKAFQHLADSGFISCVEESMFSSRTESKSRGWRLEWLPFGKDKPTNYWEKVSH
jgi:hypothetical protein